MLVMVFKASPLYDSSIIWNPYISNHSPFLGTSNMFSATMALPALDISDRIITVYRFVCLFSLTVFSVFIQVATWISISFFFMAKYNFAVWIIPYFVYQFSHWPIVMVDTLWQLETFRLRDSAGSQDPYFINILSL